MRARRYGWTIVACFACGGDEPSGTDDDVGPELLEVVASCSKITLAGSCSCTTWYAEASSATLLRDGYEAGCAAEGGVVVDVCSAEDSLGTCEQGGQAEGLLIETHVFRDGDDCTGGADDWRGSCESSGGRWSAGG